MQVFYAGEARLGTVLKTNLYVLSCFFNFLIAFLDISFNDSQGVRGFRRNSFNVKFPIKIMSDCDSKMFCIFICFLFDIVKFVHLGKIIGLFLYIRITSNFVWIEFHGPG